jgi:excisionase family DNA binding protein
MELITKIELAKLLRICVATIDNLVAAGKLPKPMKVGRQNRWDRITIEKWMQTQ